MRMCRCFRRRRSAATSWRVCTGPARARASRILLLAHIDVVEALREDWTTDPYQFVEKDGYYYGRGTDDDKFMAAAFVANFVRYKQEGYQPDRDLDPRADGR